MGAGSVIISTPSPSWIAPSSTLSRVNQTGGDDELPAHEVDPLADRTTLPHDQGLFPDVIALLEEGQAPA